MLRPERKLTSPDPQFQSAVKDVVGRLSGIGTVQNVRSPLAPANSGEVSHDGHSALVGFQIRGDSSDADNGSARSLAATAAAQRAHPGLTIQQAGDASADKALNKSFSDDFAKARTLSLPITLVILIFAFGALVAAGIPVFLGDHGRGRDARAGRIGQSSSPSTAVSEVVLLIGLAVGVDYSLFYMRRAREERGRGQSNQTSIAIAAATSGKRDPDVGDDGDRRHECDVPDRPGHLHGHGGGHRDRGRRGNGWIPDRGARDPVDAWGQDRP